MELLPRDVRTAAEWVGEISQRVPNERWTASLSDAWQPRRTLDHLVDAMLLYSGYVATEATHRITPLRNGDPTSTTDELLQALHAAASVLSALLEGMSDGTRAFHPSGHADRTGWVGMACTELYAHGHDIATATRLPFLPPDDRLAEAVVERVFPWAPPTGDGWTRLLWATGRASLGPLPPQDADWWWQSAPLSEWDGQPRRRSAPPQW